MARAWSEAVPLPIDRNAVNVPDLTGQWSRTFTTSILQNLLWSTVILMGSSLSR